MAVTLNASTSAGLVQTADTSGVLALQTAGTTAISISTGQVATFAQAPVLPAASIPQAALAAGVAGNGPAFSAYQSTLQSVTGATFTKIQFQTEEFDTNSNFDSTTNYRFTPTVAGYYQISARVQFTSFVNQVALFIYKNGSNFKDLTNLLGTTSVFMGSGSVLVYLNGSTDYVELYGYVAATVNTQISSSTTYFQGFLARAA